MVTLAQLRLQLRDSAALTKMVTSIGPNTTHCRSLISNQHLQRKVAHLIAACSNETDNVSKTK